MKIGFFFSLSGCVLCVVGSRLFFNSKSSSQIFSFFSDFHFTQSQKFFFSSLLLQYKMCGMKHERNWWKKRALCSLRAVCIISQFLKKKYTQRVTHIAYVWIIRERKNHLRVRERSTKICAVWWRTKIGEMAKEPTKKK